MKKFPRTADKRNAAGGLLEVERTVRKGGNVIFDGCIWHDSQLEHHVGERVIVKDAADDVWKTGPIEVFMPHRSIAIARIEKPNPDCLDCKTPLSFVDSQSTDQHDTLSYYLCKGIGYNKMLGCKCTFVQKGKNPVEYAKLS